MGLLITGVVVEPLTGADRHAARTPVDLRIVGDRIARIAPRITPVAGDEVLEGEGGSVIPGLHDHHVHLRAWAAELSSVSVGPADVADAAALGARLRASPGGPETWVRATGYHESVAGLLDRHALDALVSDRPVRLQHRSGALWMLNSRAIELLGVDATAAEGADPATESRAAASPEGLERDAAGRPTGRLWRADRWLHARRTQAAAEPPPDLAPIGRQAAMAGVTGFTDATPDMDEEWLGLLLHAHETGALPQRLHLMGQPDLLGPVLAERGLSAVSAGPVKRLLDDDRLPALDDLAQWMLDAHRRGAPVALHCVTLTQAALAVAAWHAAGARAGDRMEHGGVLSSDLVEAVAALGVAVVSQPGFLLSRGDRYLADVDPADLPDLWRLRSLLDHGVEVALSSDAPLGPTDPWSIIASAACRRTRSGSAITPAEAISARRALSLFWGEPARLGSLRAVRPGGAADLVVLDGRIDRALDAGADAIVATIAAGRVAYGPG